MPDKEVHKIVWKYDGESYFYYKINKLEDLYLIFKNVFNRAEINLLQKPPSYFQDKITWGSPGLLVAELKSSYYKSFLNKLNKSSKSPHSLKLK